MTTDTSPQATIRCCGTEFVKPRPWPVIITVFMVGLCVALGVWQVQRLQWKEGLIAELQRAQEESPITADTLPANLDELEDMNFHSVSLMGEYDYGTEFHVIGRSNSEEPGYHILTPFRIADDGRVVLVNRGWVPQDRKSVEDRGDADARSAGNIYLKGYILVPQGGSPFLPEHDRAGNFWFWQDTAAMSDEAGADFPSFVIQRVEMTPEEGALPIAKRAFDVRLRNDHFAYSLMWFALAISGIIIFAVYHRKPRGDRA